MPIRLQVPYFNIRAIIFFYVYMWRIKFTNETFKKISFWYFWLWRPQSLTNTVMGGKVFSSCEKFCSISLFPLLWPSNLCLFHFPFFLCRICFVYIRFVGRRRRIRGVLKSMLCQIEDLRPRGFLFLIRSVFHSLQNCSL